MCCKLLFLVEWLLYQGYCSQDCEYLCYFALYHYAWIDLLLVANISNKVLRFKELQSR